MALAYPEGECFFVRSGLRAGPAHAYNADIPQHFHNHMMVEYIWNKPADSGNTDTNNPSGHTHPRSAYSIVRRGVRTRHGNWHNLPFSYGPSEDRIERRVEHELCTDANTFDSYYNGASAEAWFMHMPMPWERERWVWIDMLACIRAIYIPLAFTADENHPQLCGWVQVNFAQSRTVSIWRGNNIFAGHSCDSTNGLGMYRHSTIGFDVHGLIQLLSLPRQLRKDNPYASRLIKIVPRGNILTRPLSTHYRATYDIDWTRVANANFGLDVQWKPAQRGTWIGNFMMNVITFGLGMIPLAGPFLAILFPVAWTLVVDPDSAYDLLRDLAPGVDLSDRIIRNILDSINETKEYLPDGWETLALPAQPSSSGAGISQKDDGRESVTGLEELGKSLAFIMAEETLANSGRAPVEEEPPADGDDTCEVEVVNPPTVFPDEKGEPATFD